MKLVKVKVLCLSPEPKSGKMVVVSQSDNERIMQSFYVLKSPKTCLNPLKTGQKFDIG